MKTNYTNWNKFDRSVGEVARVECSRCQQMVRRTQDANGAAVCLPCFAIYRNNGFETITPRYRAVSVRTNGKGLELKNIRFSDDLKEAKKFVRHDQERHEGFGYVEDGEKRVWDYEPSGVEFEDPRWVQNFIGY